MVVPPAVRMCAVPPRPDSNNWTIRYSTIDSFFVVIAKLLPLCYKTKVRLGAMLRRQGPHTLLERSPGVRALRSGLLRGTLAIESIGIRRD